MQESLLEVYNNRLKEWSKVLAGLKQKRRRIGWIRLVSIVLTFSFGFYFFPENPLIAWIVVVLGITCFLIAVAADSRNNESIAHAERMLFINSEEILILQHDFNHREDGRKFLPHDHPYAVDLDLFGAYSLYQYINRCTSEQANNLLANQLLNPIPFERIIKQQAAIKELATNLDWRQEIAAAGMANPLSAKTEERIKDWLQLPMPYQHKLWKLVVIIYPMITIGCFVAYILDYLPAAAFSGLVGLFFIIGLSISKNINSIYASLSKIVDEIVTLRQQLLHFEKLTVQSTLLTSLQACIQSGGKASENIQHLKQILNRFDYRLNMLVFFVLNTFLLWDLRQLLGLMTWQKRHGLSIEKWIATIAQVELLNSLATLAYNHPTWVFAHIVPEHFTLVAQDVGHPLIAPKKRVDNSFSTRGTGKVSIITGSNMAGKSTFLRSIGVNIVLAQMGSVVCAKRFEISPVQLCTSMRVTDNLAENTSTFYAELKKLKSIIDKVKLHEKIFILLDEILRGTNSLDRHTGSKALVKQLIGERAVAVIATHDVELAALEKSYITTVKNYHFDVQVEGEELYFDYKLKDGICQSLNASLLMKKIGIEIEPN